MKIFWKLSCFMLMLGFSSWSFSDTCFDDKEGLPKGAYLKPHCSDNPEGNCIESKFEYDPESDSLTLRLVTLKGFFEKVQIEKNIALMELAGDKTLSSACDWVKAGFDIDYHIDDLEVFKFMLIPPQPKPFYEIKDGEVVVNKFKEPDLFLSDIFLNKFSHSCQEFKLYIQPDVIFYRCHKSPDSTAVASIMPYFYGYQRNSTSHVVLQNQEGVLTAIRVIPGRHSFKLEPLEFNQEIRRQCDLRGMEVREVPGGHICHTISSGILSKHLQDSSEHSIFVDIDSGYAVLDRCGDDTHLDILMNINKCLKHGLKLDYQHDHHRLFCMPGEFLRGLKDENRDEL